MALPDPVTMILKVLGVQYADKDGNERRLSPAQIVIYRQELGRFSAAELEAAARAWIRKSRFFPAVSDLLDILESPVDAAAASQLAWAAVERAIRAAGIYRGAHFPQGAIGETVRQVFGTWATACGFDYDSPGWAIRRQSFLAIFPVVNRHPHTPVTLKGIHGTSEPYQVPLVEGIAAPALTAAEDRERPATHSEAVAALANFEAHRTKSLKP
jgi:hypothetical protein